MSTKKPQKQLPGHQIKIDGEREKSSYVFFFNQLYYSDITLILTKRTNTDIYLTINYILAKFPTLQKPLILGYNSSFNQSSTLSSSFICPHFNYPEPHIFRDRAIHKLDDDDDDAVFSEGNTSLCDMEVSPGTRGKGFRFQDRHRYQYSEYVNPLYHFEIWNLVFLGVPSLPMGSSGKGGWNGFFSTK